MKTDNVVRPKMPQPGMHVLWNKGPVGVVYQIEFILFDWNATKIVCHFSAPGFGVAEAFYDELTPTDRPVSALEDFHVDDNLAPEKQEPLWWLMAAILLVCIVMAGLAFSIWPVAAIPEVTK